MTNHSSALSFKATKEGSMSSATQIDLAKLAKRIRKHCVRMTGTANASHVGGSLSAADLLAAVYGRALRYDPQNPQWADRDRFIMSKGHACSALYAVLAESGYFPVERLETFYQNGSPLAGHVMHKNVPGFELPLAPSAMDFLSLRAWLLPPSATAAPAASFA